MGKKRIDTVTGQQEESNPLLDRIQKISDETIKSGEYYTTDILGNEALSKPGDYKGVTKEYAGVKTEVFDPYEDYVDPHTLRGGQFSFDKLNDIRALNQSNWEQAGNAIGRFATNVIPQIVGGFASMVDIQGYWDAEHAANNSLVNWAQDVKEWSEEAMPIYEEAPGESMQMGDFAWWMTRGESLAESIAAFAAQGMGAGKIISSLGKLIATAARGGKTTQRLIQGTEGLATATMLNQSEAVLEATQVYRTTLDNSIAKGDNYEEAKRKAAVAASTTMNLNRMNILLNITSAKAFLNPRQFTRQLIKEPSTARNLGLLGLEGGQEAMEELVNHVASKAGEAAGEGRSYDLEDALEDIGTMEGFEAAFLGALGGIGQKGGTNLLRRISHKWAPGSTVDEEGNVLSAYQANRKRYDEQQKIINELKENGVKTDALQSIQEYMLLLEKRNKALFEGDEAKVEEIQEQFFENQALKAFQSGTTEILENLLKEEAGKNPEEVGQEHTEKANQAIKNLKELEGIYNNYQGYSNVGEIFMNRATAMRNERFHNAAKQSKNDVDNALSNTVHALAKNRSIETEREILIKKEGQEDTTETVKETVPLTYDLNNLEKIPVENATEKGKKEYNKFVKEVQALPQFEQAEFYDNQVDTLQKIQIELDKELAKFTSDDHQQKYEAEQLEKQELKKAKSDLDKATTAAEVEKLKRTVKNEQFQKEADDKLKDLEEAKEKEILQKNQNEREKKLSDKINKAKPETEDTLRKEIDSAKISKDAKDRLHAQVDRMVSGEEEGSRLSKFSQESPEEQEWKETQKDLETKAPKDIVDPTTQEEETEKFNEAGEEEVKKDKTFIQDEVDESGNLVYDYMRATQGHNRLAYLSRDYTQLERGGVVWREENTDVIQNKHLLDRNKYLPGTKITLSVDAQYVGEKYDSTSDEKETISWPEREAQLKEEYGEGYRDRDEYIGEIPIMITDEHGNHVAYLHDADWIKEENLATTAAELAADKEQLMNMRRAVLNKGEINTTITYKSFGRLIKPYNREDVLLAEAMPDKNLIIGIGNEDGEFDTPVDISESEKMNKYPSLPGRPYAMIPIGPNEYFPAALKKNKLSKEARDSMMAAIKLFIAGDDSHPVVQQIVSTSGIDITTIMGLRKYLAQFTQLVRTDKNEGIAPILKSTKYSSATRLITVTGNGIEFGRPQVRMDKNQFLSKKTPEHLLRDIYVKLEAHLEETLSNVNQESLMQDIDILYINEDDTTTPEKYLDYVKKSHTTKYLSVNIGTKENPNWAYTIQPTIIIDTSFAGEIKPKVSDKVSIEESGKENIVENTEEEQTSKEPTDTITLAHGLTIDNTQEEDDEEYSDEDTLDDIVPADIEGQVEQEREEYSELIIKGIGLSEQQSMINYVASQIIQSDIDARSKERARISNEQIFDKFREGLKEQKAFYEKHNLVNKAKKIQAILNNFTTFQQLVKDQVGLYAIGTVQDVELSEEQLLEGMEKTVFVDEWKFSVSGKNTASARLRLFLSDIQNMDESGPRVNSLGFPDVVPFDKVYDTLKGLLTNKPADYALMTQFLELYQEAHPWLQNVIAKLDKASFQIQNEFASAMTSHMIDMRFLVWSKDKNGNYYMKEWSSNSTAIEYQLRKVWNSNLKGNITTNLVVPNEAGDYVFNDAEKDLMIAQAEEWASDTASVTNEDLSQWLRKLGIELSDATLDDLRAGKFRNKGKKSWDQLFNNSRGLVRVLKENLQKLGSNALLEDSDILKDTVVKSLTKLEALNNNHITSNSFNSGNKTIYSFNNNHFLISRMLEFTAVDDDGNFVHQDLYDNLSEISFTRDSLWLKDLKDKRELGNTMRETFSMNYLGLEAIKKLYTQSKDDRKLNNISEADHEVIKLGFFLTGPSNVNKAVTNQTKEQRRKVSFFYPTLSDKTTAITIEALARELKMSKADKKLTKESLELLYNALVVPEISRMAGNKPENVEGYDAGHFYMVKSLNDLTVEIEGEEVLILDLAKANELRENDIAKEAILNELSNVFDNLLAQKLEDWQEMGIGVTNKEENVKHSFLNTDYMRAVEAKGFKGNDAVAYAAGDFIFNSLIANAEMTKLFIGDPAQYWKNNLEETYINIGKRLAGDIAPGIQLAEHKAHKKYLQLFLQDTKMESNNVKDSVQLEYFSKIQKDYKKNYSGIQGSDAQEYTTWREHLFVLKQLGRITTKQHDAIKQKLTEGKSLEYDEIGLVLQPIKPVYVGNHADVKNNIDRRVYIKSSSFPLLPQFTSGLAIDKIRIAMEELEEDTDINSTGMTVRASFGTANKVGAITNSVKVFNEDGTVVDNLKFSKENTLTLERKNFRIQQDVPYDRAKETTNIGTQDRKLLFVDFLDLTVSKGVKGADLKAKYDKAYQELFEDAYESTAKELGMLQLEKGDLNIENLLVVPETSTFEKPVEGDERVNYINNNFNNIIKQLVKSKVNVFFKDENDNHKECEE